MKGDERDPNEPFAVYADHAANLVGLSLAPEHRPGVAMNLALLSGIARQLSGFPLPDPLGPAPVFEP